MHEAESGASGRGGDDSALHRHCLEHFHVCPGRDGSWNDNDIALVVKRLHVGDIFEQANSGGNRDSHLACNGLPVKKRLRSSYGRELGIGKAIDDTRPNLLHEEKIGENVGKVAERSDEEQAPAGRLGRRSEPREIDAVGNEDSILTPGKSRVLGRHYHHAARTSEGTALEAMPAPPVPASGRSRLPLADLAVKIERNVMLD